MGLQYHWDNKLNISNEGTVIVGVKKHPVKMFSNWVKNNSPAFRSTTGPITVGERKEGH